MGISIFFLKNPRFWPITHKEFEPKFPLFWNLKLEYFPIEKVLHKTAKYGKLSFFKLIMSEVSKDLRNIFLSPKPPILKTWSWIFFR